eukprot:Gregarina_sp_Poly_1__2941@NODE_1821_length_3272_cov_43_482995_g1181_i0_p1_GENE_NODE_1821_length_3272_cov_43_482995_g1181_i0NODE_1821_length_3272_cov_43_482995_g1181_i0_p1_ORF_typecomplete_len378_score41_59DUF1697/PF08002_11/7_9e03DUF1697/PF08002_11/0_024_NODE_1821_length_3272_cov_43_482995_g1181_i08862019
MHQANWLDHKSEFISHSINHCPVTKLEICIRTQENPKMRQVVEARRTGPKCSRILLIGVSSLMRAHAIPSIIHRSAPPERIAEVSQMNPMETVAAQSDPMQILTKVSQMKPLEKVVEVSQTSPLEKALETPSALFDFTYDWPVHAEERSDYLTPPYLRDEPLPTMSVNAGNKYGIVGGGGINREFALILKDVNPTLPIQFRRIHTEALKSSDPIENCDVISWAFKSSRTLVDAEAGTVYIDYLKDGSKRPCHEVNNMGMLYTVGPNGKLYGENQGQEFLSDVTTTAYTLMFAVDEWNKRYPDKSIKNIRVPLISGNIFKHPQTTAEQVAKAIREGIESYKISSPIHVVYAWAGGAFTKSNPFWEAAKESLPNAPNKQ